MCLLLRSLCITSECPLYYIDTITNAWTDCCLAFTAYAIVAYNWYSAIISCVISACVCVCRSIVRVWSIGLHTTERVYVQRIKALVQLSPNLTDTSILFSEYSLNKLFWMRLIFLSIKKKTAVAFNVICMKTLTCQVVPLKDNKRETEKKRNRKWQET